jgi:hypothetical protein
MRQNSVVVMPEITSTRKWKHFVDVDGDSADQRDQRFLAIFLSAEHQKASGKER